MKIPSLEELDKKRQEGFRPGFVFCFIQDGKILLLYKNDYECWLVPQEGIEPNEDLESAKNRGIKEEMGQEFLNYCDPGFEFIYEDKLEFAKNKQNTRDLHTNDGTRIWMKGKYYYYIVVKNFSASVDLKNTEFDTSCWVDYITAKYLNSKMQQKNKREIFDSVLDILHSNRYIK